MATVNRARVIRVDRFPEKGAVLLRLRMEEPEQLPHIAGQYVIVNSGMTYPNGKAGKRAYSLFAADAEKREFCLAAERIEDGLVSAYLNDREVGDEVLFSGPWGKFQAPSESWQQPIAACAFATGITALLGLLSAHPLPAASRLVWVRDPRAAFLPDNCVKDWLPRDLARFEIIDASGETMEKEAWAAIADLLPENPLVYAAGEGQSIDALELLLQAEGRGLIKESFFRKPLPLS